jgi:hypothetical protein
MRFVHYFDLAHAGLKSAGIKCCTHGGMGVPQIEDDPAGVSAGRCSAQWWQQLCFAPSVSPPAPVAAAEFLRRWRHGCVAGLIKQLLKEMAGLFPDAVSDSRWDATATQILTEIYQCRDIVTLRAAGTPLGR